MSTDAKKDEVSEETPDFKKITKELEQEYVEFSNLVREETKKVNDLLKEDTK